MSAGFISAAIESTAKTAGDILAAAGAKAQREQQNRQWQNEFRQRQKEFDQTFAATQKQQAWERQWGDILNNLTKQQGRQNIRLGDEEVMTNAIQQQLLRNDMLKQQEALKNFTLGQSQALLNSRRGQQTSNFRGLGG